MRKEDEEGIEIEHTTLFSFVHEIRSFIHGRSIIISYDGWCEQHIWYYKMYYNSSFGFEMKVY